MGDQTTDVAAQGTGTVPLQGSSGTEGGAAAQPKYLTQDEMLAILEKRDGELFKRVQHLNDASNQTILNKVQKQVNEIAATIAMQREAGMTITQEDEDKLVQQVFNKAMHSASTTGNTANESSTTTEVVEPPEGGEEDDEWTLEAARLQQEADVWLDPKDPEFAKIKANAPHPYEFLKSVEEAIAEKKARLAASADQGKAATSETKPPEGGRPPEGTDQSQIKHRAPTSAGDGKAGSTLPDGTAMDFFKMAYKQGS